eukprot:4318523-Prymnesium_polylepis.1
MHAEYAPGFLELERAHAEQLEGLKADVDALSVAATSEHIAVSRMNAEGLLAAIAALRREARDKQAVVGTHLVVLHTERMQQLAEANEQRLQQAFSAALCGVQLQNAKSSARMISELQHGRHEN